MTIYLNLYKRDKDKIFAHLTVDKVEIYDEKLTHFLKGGISFPRTWEKEFGFPHKTRIHPGENDKHFAKAFLEEYFVHGLMQMGYHWKDQDGKSVVIWDRDKKEIVGTIEAIFIKEITQISDKISNLNISEEKTKE